MADTENSTFNTARVLGNEIVKADDFNFGFESLVYNISKFAQMIFECERDFVIGGKVTVDSGTNVKVAPIFGVCASTGEPFGMTEQSDVISITQNDYHSRVDIIEAKGEWVTYDEQQRAFNDLDNDIVTYQNIDVKQRLKVTYRVKNGVNDSVVAPLTDEGWVKIAEIKYAQGTVELSESDILNITADVAELENSEWTNEKTKTYNVNYISSVNERFRVEHNVDGTHKNGVIHAAQVDFGTGNKQVNASKIPVTSSGTVGNATYTAGDSVNATLVSFANQITTIYNNYLKYGANCFKGEVALSLLADGNVLKKPLVFGAAGDGTAYCKIGTKNIFSITADGKLRMVAGYVPSDSMDVVTKGVTDAINNVIDGIDKRVTTLESTSDSTVYANNLFSRFSYVAGKIDAATTANISLSGLQTVDGISLRAGMLVLVKNQTDAKKNGIYEVNSNAWQRHSEFVTFALIKHKLYIIGGGSANKNKIFYTPQENFSGKLGESNLTFSEYGKIDTQQIKDAAVTNDKIKDSSIALSKLQQNALLNFVYPVGSLYWSSKSTNPSTLFGGTWTQIKDKFVLACGDTYKTTGATGGNASIKLTVANLPSHNHTFTPSGTIKSTFTGSSHSHTFTPSGTVESHSHVMEHDHSFSGTTISALGHMLIPSGDRNGNNFSVTDMYNKSHDNALHNYYSISIESFAHGSRMYAPSSSSDNTGFVYNLVHSHEYSGTTNKFKGFTRLNAPAFTGTAGTTGSTTQGGTVSSSFTGNSGNTGSVGSGTSLNTMPPYVVKYCWERTA